MATFASRYTSINYAMGFISYTSSHGSRIMSCQLQSINTLQQDQLVYHVKVDLCMHGMTPKSGYGHPARAKTPTTLVPISWEWQMSSA